MRGVKGAPPKTTLGTVPSACVLVSPLYYKPSVNVMCLVCMHGRCIPFGHLMHGANIELKGLRDCLLRRGRFLVESSGSTSCNLEVCMRVVNGGCEWEV